MSIFRFCHTINSKIVKNSKTITDNIFTNISNNQIKSSVLVSFLSDQKAQEAIIVIGISDERPKLVYKMKRDFSDENVPSVPTLPPK